MKRKVKERLGYAALNMAFVLLCAVTLVPILYAVSVSFSGAGASLSGASLGSEAAGSPQAARANTMHSASKSAKNFFIFHSPSALQYSECGIILPH